MLIVAGLIAALLTPAAEGNGCVVIDSTGRCLVAAADPGRPGGPSERRLAPSGPKSPNRASAKKAVAPEPAPAPPAVPTIGAPNGGIGGLTAPLRRPDPAAFMAGIGQPAQPDAPPAATDPAVLAQQATNQLKIAPPRPHLSTGGAGFVGVPVWLWIDATETAAVSATATAGAASVTATGRLTSVEWRMGPPGAVVHCTGPGTPWTGQAGPSPDCGYTYTQRSLPERTAGSGAWTITATAVWTVTWNGQSAGAPVAGETTLALPVETSLSVGEVQVLVPGGGR